jgi:two-component system, NarL family, response regulator DevR
VPLSVLICDDHDMVRDALSRVLNDVEDIEVLTTSSSVDDTVAYFDSHPDTIDVAVVDVRLDDGLGHDITRWIKNNLPTVKVVLLTSFMDDELLVEAYTSNADAIVLKGSPTSELVEAIRDVHAGIRRIDGVAAREASRRLSQTSHHKLLLLDPVDREIAQLIAQGLTDREIASSVHFGLQTIKNRVSKIWQTVGAINRTQLAVMVATASMNNTANEPHT